MQRSCIHLRHLRYLRENNTQAYSSYCTNETLKSPADLADDADKPQNHNNRTNCLSLRNNAALLHSSAGSALSAGEYSHKSTQAIGKEETSMSPADLADCAEKYNCGKPYYFSALKFTIRPSRLSIAIL